MNILYLPHAQYISHKITLNVYLDQRFSTGAIPHPSGGVQRTSGDDETQGSSKEA